MAFSSLAELVAAFENPSGDPTKLNYAYDATHTASGLYQITNSTWNAYAPGAGVDTSIYPSAASAPSNVQNSVFGAIVAQRGLQDWTCAGCNPPLSNYLVSDPSAASLPVFAGGQSVAPVGVPTSPYGGDGGASVGAGGSQSITQPGSLADKAGNTFSGLTGWLTAVSGRVGLFLLALIFLGGAFLLFAMRSNDSVAPAA